MPEHVSEYEAEVGEEWKRNVRRKRKVETVAEVERRCIFAGVSSG